MQIITTILALAVLCPNSWFMSTSVGTRYRKTRTKKSESFYGALDRIRTGDLLRDREA